MNNLHTHSRSQRPLSPRFPMDSLPRYKTVLLQQIHTECTREQQLQNQYKAGEKIPDFCLNRCFVSPLCKCVTYSPCLTIIVILLLVVCSPLMNSSHKEGFSGVFGGSGTKYKQLNEAVNKLQNEINNLRTELDSKQERSLNESMTKLQDEINNVRNELNSTVNDSVLVCFAPIHFSFLYGYAFL